MTDDLHTRITAVQRAHMPDQYKQDMGECPCGFIFSTYSELADHVADAVIRELGLEREKELDEENGLLTLTRRHRYVTDWTPE